MKHLFTLSCAICALTAVNAQTTPTAALDVKAAVADPSQTTIGVNKGLPVYNVDETTGEPTTAVDPEQVNYWFVSDTKDVLVLSAYNVRQSKPSYFAQVGGGSSGIDDKDKRKIWTDALEGTVFKGWQYWGVEVEKDSLTTTFKARAVAVKSSNTYFVRVSNTTKLQALVNEGGSKRTLTFDAYEVVNGTRKTEVAKTISTAGTGNKAVVLTLELDGTKTYDIKMSSNSSSNSQVYELAFTPVSSTTAIESVEAAVSAQTTKIIENGQIYILKNGVKYNLLGSIVR